jgi:hypothetical protein
LFQLRCRSTYLLAPPLSDTDWQDLFFDLLFAGSAFCGAGFLGESLINGQEIEGFFYFVVMFLCLANQWVMRIHYCSRFASTSVFHALILEQLEFVLIALATWHIPLAQTDYIARYSSSRMLASTDYSSDLTSTFTPVEQMQANVKGCASGFSLCLGLNTLLYVCRWAEIKYDPLASKGARAIANYSVKMYGAVTAVFFVGFVLAATTTDEEYYEDESSAWCKWIWCGAIATFYGSLAFWTTSYGALELYEAKAHSVPMSVTYVIVRVGEVYFNLISVCFLQGGFRVSVWAFSTLYCMGLCVFSGPW